MDIRAAEISSILKEQIKNFGQEAEVSEVGQVLSVGDGIARIYGLSKAMAGELLEFDTNKGAVRGQVMNLELDTVGAVIYGNYLTVREGDTVKSTSRLLEIPAGDAMLGRVVNPLGEAIDGGPPIETGSVTMKLDIVAPGIAFRQPVKEPLQTGIKAIDSMIPIGRGQRELIIGDRQTGKTAICVDAFLNAKNNDLICIYVAIGQKMSTVKSVVKTLEDGGVMEKCIVVAAPASDQASMQFLSPFSGAAMGERFRDEGGHVLIVYDDLYKHALAWRQVSLLLRRPPGREAFPGDIFNLHSRLLERAAKLNKDLGGGSLTALPIIETQAGDIATYIPTNVISITDGQIYLEADMFNAGNRPAVNAGLSVSRVGGSAQRRAMRKVAGRIRLDLAQYRELASFAQFGTQDLDAATRQQLERGQRTIEVLKQGQFQPQSLEHQVVVFFAVSNGYVDEVPIPDMARWETEFVNYMDTAHPEVAKSITETNDLTEETTATLTAAIEEFQKGFTAQ